jgi:hypothetical protein
MICELATDDGKAGAELSQFSIVDGIQSSHSMAGGCKRGEDLLVILQDMP